VEHLLTQLTGAEAGFAVNNNASAVLLGLAALAQGGEVIVSRGEAVEIGGGFRIPEVLQQSGAKLVEVGTTNRTYARDYERAITERTAAILKVHASNFKVVGFTHAPTLEELVELGRRHKVAVLHDLGSGCLLRTADLGLAPEPMPQESIAAGVDLVFFSGDKLLGGPQAGIILGKKSYVEQLRAHPLARAVRIDKLTLAALVATLLHYIKNEVFQKVPVWQMLSANVEKLEERAEGWATALGRCATVVDGQSTVGGGSMPGETLPSRLLAVNGGPVPPQQLVDRLRNYPRPVVARVEDGQVLLDPRTVLEEEDQVVLEALRWALQKR
jgi:L-seryl-tRNA(Ser) seleniumtransferase